MEEFKELLLATLNSNRDTRKQAEQKLQNLFQDHPTWTFQSLISLIPSSSDPLSTLSSVLLHNVYLKQGLIKLIDSPVSQNASNLFLDQLSNNLSPKTKNKIGQILVGLSVIEGNESSFLSYVANCCQNLVSEVTVFGFHMLKISFKYPTLRNLIQQQANYIASLIADKISNREICEIVIVCLYSILKHIEMDECRLLEASFLKSLEVIINYYSLETIIGLLKITEKKPEIWIGKEKQLIHFSFTIVNKTDISNDIRVNTVEILRTFLNLKTFQGYENSFLRDCITIGFILLAEPEYSQDIELWAAENDDLVFSTFRAGFDLLNELHEFSTCQLLIQEMANAHLSTNYWVHQNAGIIASLLLKTPDINNLLTIPGSNPRLLWSLLDTFEYTIIAKNSYNLLDQILSFTLNATKILYLSNTITLKIKVKCLLVIERIFFKYSVRLQELSPSISMLIPDTYNEIIKALADNATILAGIKALTMLIITNGEYFAQVSSQFISGLANILNSPVFTYKDKEIRAACLHCWSSIVKHVLQFTSLSELFTELWKIKQGMDETDIGLTDLWSTILEIYERLKEGFSGYLQLVVNDLVLRTNLEIDSQLKENAANQAIKIIIPEQIKISDSINEGIKQEASKLLCEFIEKSPQAMKPYLILLLQASSSLVNLDCNAKLKIDSLKILSLLPKIDRSDSTLLTTFQIIIERLPKMKDFTEACYLLKYSSESLAQFLSISIIGYNNAEIFCNLLTECLREVLASKSESLTGIVVYITDIICLLIKSFKELFIHLFNLYLHGTYSELLFDGLENPEILLRVLGLYCDYIHYTGDLFLSDGVCLLIEQFLKLCYYEIPEIRQKAVTAVVECLEKDPKVIKSEVKQVKSALFYLIELHNARDLYLETSELAISGLVKIGVLFQSQIIETCLNWIPLITNPEKASKTHQLLINNHKLIPNSQNFLQFLGSSPYLDDQSRQLLSNLIDFN